MAQRKPAVSTLLKQAQARVAELEKQLETEKNSSKYAREARDAAKAEADQIHAFLDALPGAIKKRNDETYVEHSAMTRLAAWLATSRA
ncbi:hypothetical protein K6Y74_01805 [Burkholderia cenocepacia]|uniref:hypothetical protein n=1 Tax=Burkholderia cenocepacia TaxID=95486 RepID=UPI0013E09EC5|nr:hypothetical protein [Burkholderia cenocepacia]MCW3581747.1 hypothetical protein [Burkholderia cenocepacia]MCW3626679.1 hypothetical protein [Burkholderia cenocepacia]MCW3641953.1 hypothetical protein [Burkholderia cenocepacia]MCW5179767.1 hypothetical protein [Burkholderia cenocepacia]NGO94390.1 hypothetical protein [Burkholderia cenocepacia]